MQGHQKNSKNNPETMWYTIKQCSNNILLYRHGIYPGSPKVTLGQQYNVGEKPTVILYTTYINPHAELPSITKQDNIVQSQEDST